VTNTIEGAADDPKPAPRAAVPPIVLKEVYEQRFDDADHASKEAIWRELGAYLQRFIVPGAARTCAAIFAGRATDGVAVVLVEQNVDLARRIATRTLVLHDGRAAPALHAYDRR